MSVPCTFFKNPNYFSDQKLKHNLRTLKLFLSIAKTQSFAQASEVENIAASAISKRISDLEHHIGTPLFYRQTKGVELTPAGREMVLHASNIMRLVERMDANMGDYASGLRGTVRIAANTSAITQFLPEDLACFIEQHPDMKIELTEQTSEDILDAVRDGLADVGIFSGQISPSDLDELTYRRDTLVVIMAKTHPDAEAPGNGDQMNNCVR